MMAVLAVTMWAGGCRSGPDDLPDEIEFNRHIRPILSNSCFTCHGPDPGTREADLRLDLREVAVALREGYDRPAIAPGDAGDSELMRRVHSTDPEVRMPPPGTRKPLTEREIALLERWIEDGAEWQPHWFYIPPEKREPPTIGIGPVRNPIDAFVGARLEKTGQQFSPQADPATLVRRLSFDLVGLPPTFEQVRRYEGDPTEERYDALVEDLLASPHFGERMAIMWLDLVRYADTDGYHSDLHRNISAYRGYVIRAFNSNKPFDQFTREQIAGDLLPHASTEHLVASAFNRLGQATKEGGSQPKEYLAKYAGDRVRTVSVAWMGSTVGCAECHDHKFDPFTQSDFYKFASFFADINEKGVYLNRNVLLPEIPLPDRAEADELQAMDEDIATRRRADVPVEALLKRREDLLATVPHILATKSVEPRTMRLLRRGDWRDNEGPIVEPGLPEFLPPLRAGGRATRLDLADWLVSEQNPMTARVFVNNLWAQFFGSGLSRVLDDLGSQGEWPSHPDLLDWLAIEFVESGWDVKHMVRLIVSSTTYRQSSKADQAVVAADPENRLLARQSRVRLPAELVRDNALAVSGLLDRSIGGESVKPYQPEGYWSDIRTFGADGPASTWEASTGSDQYRRGLYTYWKRSFLHPSMLAFDAPDRQECTARRARSNTPLQALVLLNDPTYVEAARVFAERVLTSDASGADERIRWAFQHALGRSPSDEEGAELNSLLSDELARYQDQPAEAEKLVATGQSPALAALDTIEHAAWTAVARALFNTHEFVTRY